MSCFTVRMRDRSGSGMDDAIRPCVSTLISDPQRERYSWNMKLHTRHVLVAVLIGALLLVLASLARGWRAFP